MRVGDSMFLPLCSWASSGCTRLPRTVGVGSVSWGRGVMADDVRGYVAKWSEGRRGQRSVRRGPERTSARCIHPEPQYWVPPR